MMLKSICRALNGFAEISETFSSVRKVIELYICDICSQLRCTVQSSITKQMIIAHDYILCNVRRLKRVIYEGTVITKSVVRRKTFETLSPLKYTFK